MEKNKEVELLNKQIDGIGYTGKITVSLVQNDRMLSTKTYHNTGTSKLFEFLADCLTGEWADAKANRPCKIVLFKTALAETDGTFDKNYWTADEAVSPAIMHDTAIPTIQVEDGGFAAIYHFRIPFWYLTAGAAVKKLGLYPKLVSRYEDDLLAYFFLDEAINVPSAGGNFTVVIDWSLAVSNKEAVV